MHQVFCFCEDEEKGKRRTRLFIHLNRRITSNKNAGLVDTAEMGELIYLVDRQKKRLHFGAPTLRVPPAGKELWQHALLKGLTAQDRAEVSFTHSH